MENKKQIYYIITGALIAAAYAGLTFLGRVFPLGYGIFEFRISEVLTLLPIFTPAAIPGLSIGCFISNIASFNVFDIVFGTAATLVAAIFTYYLRNIKLKGLPILSMLPPVIVNALVFGFQISWFFMPDTSFWWGFLVSAFSVGFGEFVVCYAFGIPFYLVVKKHNIFNRKLGR